MGQEGYKVGLPIGFQCAQEEARGENGNKYKKNGGVFTNRIPAVFTCCLIGACSFPSSCLFSVIKEPINYKDTGYKNSNKYI